MKDRDIEKIIEILRESVKEWKQPVVTQIAERDRDPFRILISTILSLRTKDEVTKIASERLFSLARTPEEMLRLEEEEIERAIYPVGFYRNKAKTIKEI
ncbi:MAG TPA: hypothetical protein P5310_03775 [bacterium]|nr:hypothetical protein [bacterium]